MSDDEALQRRLRAVERSLTDGDHDVDALRDAGTRVDRIEELEAQLADAEDRITELEATTQALRGYVGNVRSVNEDVERRADAALAAVERLEERFDDGAQPPPRGRESPVQRTNSSLAAARSPDRSMEDTDSETGGEEGDDDGDDGVLARVRRAL